MARSDRINADQLLTDSFNAIEILKKLAGKLEVYNDQLEEEIRRREDDIRREK